MRKILLALTAMLVSATASGQNVAWTHRVEPLGGDNYRIVLEAAIPARYHMYDMGPYEDGPNATTITFAPGAGATLDGGVELLTAPSL